MLGLKRIFYFFASIILLFILIQSCYSLPVIYEESGFGLDTPAGRGGKIYKVTNLEPSGEGSLRECVEGIGPRVCLFEVSGTIYITKNLDINNPYITIAGQSAPSPGISIAGAGITVQTHDVLIQHIRVRVGDCSFGPSPGDRDAIKIGSESNDVFNIVIDHVSASWSIDEILSTWSENYQVYNVSIINSIFSEALSDSKHPEGRHSMGVLIGKNSRYILLKNNLFVHNNARNPLVRDDSTNVIIANNLIYGSGRGSKDKIYFGSRGEKDVPLRAAVIGNLYLSQRDNSNLIYIEENSPTFTDIFLRDNTGASGSKVQWEMALGRNHDVSIDYPPIWVEGLGLLNSSELNILLNTSGARPLDRDLVDKRIINDIRDYSGRIIDSQDDVGGWPELDMNTRELSLPFLPNVDFSGNGYTNLEEWLKMYSYNVEIGNNSLRDKEDLELISDEASPVFEKRNYIFVAAFVIGGIVFLLLVALVIYLVLRKSN